MSSNKYWYLHVARATDLRGRDAIIYRLFEMLPGFLSLSTLGIFVALSFIRPVWAAYLTIFFSIYWLFKTFYLSVHLRYNFKRLRHNLAIDWSARLHNLSHEGIVHIVIFPMVDEPYAVAAGSVGAVVRSGWDPKRLFIMISVEERAGKNQKDIADRIASELGKDVSITVLVHPSNLPGEIPGKGANISFAAEEARKRILDPQGLRYEKILVSAFDIDTVVYPQYFSCLTWHYLTAERPERSSFQPVPLYNNNIWHAPMLSRVIAYSSSFWQMIQQERPEKLATFSSHAVPFKQLHEAGYWQRNVVSEDSRIFWNLFVRYDGDYDVVPMAYPISMDVNAAKTLWQTAKNIYRQHRRWTYGAENIPYILFSFLKNPRIPRWKKFRLAFVQIEGFWSLVTHPLILFAVGWLPLFVGGRSFNVTVLSYSLPFIARTFLDFALLGLLVTAYIALHLVPERPPEYGRWKSVAMFLQWLLVPFTMVIFSSIPGLDAQIRLMTGKYLGFWVTPKRRPQFVEPG
ncbi:MAG TPA: glycosyltransferase family 2 protein [Candidatus Paceibacterota bacterium]